MTFEETYLNDNILDALYDMRFEEMTPIQEQPEEHVSIQYPVDGGPWRGGLSVAV